MKRYLILENGETFEGLAFGDMSKNATGELVFTTVVTGINEFIYSPKNYGRAVLFTFPSVGNCGFTADEMEKKPYISACIVHEWCDAPSAENAPYTLDAYLKKHGIPGIYGIDCRALTRTLVKNGTMTAMICDEIPSDLSAARSHKETSALEVLNSGKSIKTYTPNGEVKYRAALYDLGASDDIIKALTKNGILVTSVPAPASYEEVIKLGADIYVIGDGADSPDINGYLLENIRKIIENKPFFGVGLGHCLIALSKGAETEKLPHGHRGGGNPIKDTSTGKTIIAVQDHAYAVKNDSVKVGCVRFVSANDGTAEGIEYENGITAEFISDGLISALTEKIKR